MTISTEFRIRIPPDGSALTNLDRYLVGSATSWRIRIPGRIGDILIFDRSGYPVGSEIIWRIRILEGYRHLKKKSVKFLKIHSFLLITYQYVFPYKNFKLINKSWCNSIVYGTFLTYQLLCWLSFRKDPDRHQNRKSDPDPARHENDPQTGYQLNDFLCMWGHYWKIPITLLLYLPNTKITDKRKASNNLIYLFSVAFSVSPRTRCLLYGVVF